MKPQEGYLHEYDSLRQEIVSVRSRGGTVMNLVWGGIVVIVGASTYIKTPEIMVAAYFLSLAGWIEHLREHRSYEKIGAYIETILEPRTPGLQWETIRSKCGDAYSSEVWSRHRAIWDAVKSRYAIAMLAVITIFIVMCLVFSVQSELHTGSRGGMLVMMLATYLCLVRCKIHSHSDRRKFRDLFACVSDEKCNVSQSQQNDEQL